MSTVRFDEAVQADAKRILEECMGTEPAFCQARCPMHTDVRGYVKYISAGQYDKALSCIREKLFLPGVLGRICAHPCEMECRRNREFGEPISIAALKRFAADRADWEELWDPKIGEDTGHQVAVIGSGPAGAQAAIDLRRAGHHVTIFERDTEAGGMLRRGIPAYRLPKTILDREYRYLEQLGIRFAFGVYVGTDLSLEELREKYDAVIIAVGAWKGTVVPVPGNDAQGVYTALEFLREISLEGEFPSMGKRVLVVGGGDVAMDCARSALRLGADAVLQCSLEAEEMLPASPEEKEEALEEGVICHFGWGPEEILTAEGKVRGIRLRRIKRVYDDRGGFAPEYDRETMEMEVDTILMATGQRVEDVTGGVLKQGARGCYQADPSTLATDLEGVFVAGDAAGSRIVVEAMALGRKAAISVNRYLSGEELLQDRDLDQEWSCGTKLEVPLPEGTKDLPRVHKKLRDAAERVRDFEPVDLGLDEEEALAEASRCLQCGCRLCMSECVMMQEEDRCPREIAKDVLEGTLAAPLSYACNDCDFCDTVCPKELPVREMFMGARRGFVQSCYGRSPMEGHRAVEVHQDLGFSSLYTTFRGGDKNE